MAPRQKGGPGAPRTGNNRSIAIPKSARARSARATGCNPETVGNELIPHVTKTNHPPAYSYYIRARDRARRGNNSGALADITSAIKANPRFALAYFERGYIQHYRGDFRAAIEAYTVAITLAPSISVFYARRAKARLYLGDFSGAYADFTRVLELDQDILKAHVRGWRCPGNNRPVDFNDTNADLVLAIKMSKKRLNARYAEACFGRVLARVGIMVLTRTPDARRLTPLE